jgi:hypothetical protein
MVFAGRRRRRSLLFPPRARYTGASCVRCAVVGAKLQAVECRVLPLDGVDSVRLAAKGLDEQTGSAVYLGSLTIPFRDFSFVIKIQCHEQGVTGIRETLLIDEALKNGTGRLEGNRFVHDGWSFDDEQFDERFPQHPLSRLRRELRHISSSVHIDSRAKNEPRFRLPKNDTKLVWRFLRETSSR